MQSTVPQAEWRDFFDRMSKALTGKWAEIEVASLDLGDQIAAEWVPMLGITYDSKDDLLDVALDRYDHLIRHPKQIVVNEEQGGVSERRRRRRGRDDTDREDETAADAGGSRHSRLTIQVRLKPDPTDKASSSAEPERVVFLRPLGGRG